jgi:hypothetical protein
MLRSNTEVYGHPKPPELGLVTPSSLVYEKFNNRTRAVVEFLVLSGVSMD